MSSERYIIGHYHVTSEHMRERTRVLLDRGARLGASHNTVWLHPAEWARIEAAGYDMRDCKLIEPMPRGDNEKKTNRPTSQHKQASRARRR